MFHLMYTMRTDYFYPLHCFNSLPFLSTVLFPTKHFLRFLFALFCDPLSLTYMTVTVVLELSIEGWLTHSCVHS